jgi:hypothetical protein
VQNVQIKIFIASIQVAVENAWQMRLNDKQGIYRICSDNKFNRFVRFAKLHFMAQAKKKNAACNQFNGKI